MILKTDFRADGAGNLVDYIQRDRSQDAVRNVDLRNPSGRELTDAEIDRFVETSRHHDFQRHMIVSPNPDGQYTPQEVNERTREFMNQELGQQPSTEYVYAVHRDTEFPHAHVAATGRKPELEMDRSEIDRLRERASSIYNEPERAREATSTDEEKAARTPSQQVSADAREELHERELAMEEHPEKEVLREADRSREQTPSPNAERDERRSEAGQPEAEPSHESDLSQESERETEPDPERELEPEAEREPEPEPEAEAEPEREIEAEREMDWTMGGGR